jgi:hypothetical protein
MAMKYLDGVSDAEVNKIAHENAIRLFQYDPFSVRPREKCTVAALRSEATDVDTSLMARNPKHERKQVFAADLGNIGRD